MLSTPTRCAGLLLALAALPALAQSPPTAPASSRGALLYDTHCGACHSEKMHWRDKKAAVNWPSLKAQVLRWQVEQKLDWTDSDVDEVARYLNARFYRFEAPQPTLWRQR
jgi:mono/diheme cytochrome c family protein